jgi:hypothetical protein
MTIPPLATNLGHAGIVFFGMAAPAKQTRMHRPQQHQARRKGYRHRCPCNRCHSIIKLLAQGRQDMAAELGQHTEEEHAVVAQRHVTRHRHVAPADQPRIRAAMMGRDTGEP